MSRGQARLSSLVRSADSAIAGPGKFIMSHRRLKRILLGVAACSAIALALVPFRDSVGSANIALALVIVVGLVGSSEGVVAGLVTALWAAALFTLLHAIPHGHPRIEDEQDAVTAALLIGAGIISGLQQTVTERLRIRLLDTSYGIARIHQVAEAAIGNRTDDDIMLVACEQIRSELRLADCTWEPAEVDSGEWHELQHSGSIRGTGPRTDPKRLGELLVDGVAIDLGAAGRLLLRGRADSRPSPHQLKVAVIVADFAAATVSARTSST